jgi:hypothetical protein
MLVVSRVLPKLYEADTTKNHEMKQKQSSKKPINRLSYEEKKKLAKINLINSMLVIHKVKFVDTEKFNMLYKEEDKQKNNLIDRGSSIEKPKKLKKIENKISLYFRNEDTLKNRINNISVTKRKPKLKPIEIAVSKFSNLNFKQNKNTLEINKKKSIFNFQTSLREIKEKEYSVSPTNKSNKSFTV